MKVSVFVCLLMATAANCLTFQSRGQNEELGILKPDDGTANLIPGWLIELLPELIAASRQIKPTNVVDTLMAYMPFARKIMEKQSPNGRLSPEQEQLLIFTERVTPPMMRMVQEISGGDGLSGTANNVIPDDEFTTVMIKLLPDIATIINDMKAQFGGWPGTKNALDINNAFMPLARKATQYQAEFNGRQITSEEDKYLTFAETVVPPIMDYVRALYEKTVVPGQEDQIEQIVLDAIAELNPNANFGSRLRFEPAESQLYLMPWTGPQHF